MITARVLMTLLICGLSLEAWSQGETHVQGLRFYENLAQRDALYEQGLQNLSSQDELDYWMDQRNYERHLGTSNFTAYLVYMKGKKVAYHAHLEECNNSCTHSEVYLEKAREYLSVSDSEYLFGPPAEKVAQHIPKKTRN